MEQNYPDAKKHQIISFIKSAFRIAAGVVMIIPMNHRLETAGALLIVAEIIGIIEELV